MNVDKLNRQIAHGRGLAMALEPHLAAIYAAQFRKIGRQASARFRDLAVVRPITAAGGNDDTPDWVPPDVDELLNQPVADARAEKDAAKLHLQAIELATPASIRKLPEISFEVDSPFAKPLLEAVGTKGVNLGLAARDVILKVIGDSYTAGLSVPATAAALQAGIAHLADTTALMQARTDLNGLANGAAHQSVQVLGDEAPPSKQWLATEDERTRETHADADGQEVPLDQPFQVGDDLLMYPGDPDGSDAEVINCRCTVLYGDGPTTNQEADVTASATTTEETLATSGCANCTHPFAEHLGSDGPCTMNDCSCQGWQAMTATAEVGVFAAAAGGTVTWRAVLIVEGEETADGRIIDVGAIDWRELPLTLMAMIETDEGHDGAQVSGRIDNIYRDASMFDDGRVAIVGEGAFDGGDYGAEIARLVAEQTLRGVSADLGNVEIQLRPRNPITIPIGGEEFDSDGGYDEPAEADEVLVAYVKGTILGATVCPFPAIGSGAIEIADDVAIAASGEAAVIVRVKVPGFDAVAASDSLTAGAAGAVPSSPPGAWFEPPQFEEATPLTITDDGRVFGHVAAWNVCHIGNPQGPNVCTTAPRSMSGYRFFHLGELVTGEGEPIAVGQVTIDTDHAPLSLSATASSRHYADTGAVAAHVRVGEDRFGIWAAGALAEDLPVSQIRKLRAAKLSGDWRKIDGRIEMIGVLAVNVPGFPIPRPAAQIRASVDEPQVLSLVAAGILGETPPTEDQVRARISALASRALGREDLIRLAMGDEWDPLERLKLREQPRRSLFANLFNRPAASPPPDPVAAEAPTVDHEAKLALEPPPRKMSPIANDPPLVNGSLDEEIALQVSFLRDHGYYSDDPLSQFNLTRAELREAQRLASFLVVEPTAIQSVALQSRLLDKGLIAAVEGGE